MQEKILCMYSGGLDSAGALWELLTNPKYADYTILVHHIHILNHERRAYAEKAAVEATLAQLRKLVKKPFFYSDSNIDFSCLPFPSNLPFDTDIYGFIGANLAIIDQTIKYIASGSTLSDSQDSINNTNFNLRRDAIMDALFVGRNFTRQFEMLYPVKHLSKQQIYQMLPRDIVDKTWSCRRPQYINSTAQICGKCHACLAILQFRTNN